MLTPSNNKIFTKTIFFLHISEDFTVIERDP